MSILASDDFNGAVGPLTAPWVQMHTGDNIVRSGSGYVIATSFSAARYDGSISWPDNQYSKFVWGNTVDRSGPVVRASGADGTETHYWVDMNGGTTCAIRRRINGAGDATLVGPDAVSFSTGDTVELRVTGYLLEVYKNGSTLIQSVTDTDGSKIASGMPGILQLGGEIDSWEAGDLATAVSLTPAAGSLALAGQALTLSIASAADPRTDGLIVIRGA